MGSATPSDARGRRRIIVPCPQVSAIQPAGAVYGTDGIAQCRRRAGCPEKGTVGPHRGARHGAPSRVAHWRQERTCRAGYAVVKVKARQSFAVDPSQIAEDGADIDLLLVRYVSEYTK